MLSREDFYMIKQMRKQGASIIDIATQVGCSERTVRRYLKYPEPPARKSRHKMAKLKPFMDYIDTHLAENIWNGEVILAEIKAMGYTGGRSMLRYYYRRKPGDNCRDIANTQYDEKYNQAYAIGDANWQRECRTTEKGTRLVNPYQWFTSPKPASVAVTECWRCHFISASGRVLNMGLNITAISMRHSTYEARAYRNYRWQDSLSQPMEASVTLDTLTVAA